MVANGLARASGQLAVVLDCLFTTGQPLRSSGSVRTNGWMATELTGLSSRGTARHRTMPYKRARSAHRGWIFLNGRVGSAFGGRRQHKCHYEAD